ncbi:NUDIX hydrolase [Mesorhizobium sp. CAU 1732]|uniref:NUDIX hydrolase n=1 Tax=Mesorhizobium sp. CAU 1732 TaxID=3140358 RepID=UPI0032616E4C
MAKITGTTELHTGWTRFLRVDIEDGPQRFSREVEDHGNAAAVLPYDPVSRKVVLVRLLRGPMLHAGTDGMSLEVPAGIVDDGEDFMDAARREALEETGLKISDLEHIGTVWTTPGISTERIALFLAPFGPADRIATGGGLAQEHENITVVELDIAELWSMMVRGDLADMRTLTLLLALRQRHPDLFDEAD